MEPKTEFSLDFTLAAALPKTLPQLISLRYGLVVRIAGSHPAGPGSIPGTGTPFCIFSGLFVMAVSQLHMSKCCHFPLQEPFKEGFITPRIYAY